MLDHGAEKLAKTMLLLSFSIDILICMMQSMTLKTQEELTTQSLKILISHLLLIFLCLKRTSLDHMIVTKFVTGFLK